ncbi:MAG: hypothetical protein KY434_05310 [Actinobacteria bacterium]|nr:hypothetical protein [Actinomycetota bacterium]
MTGPARLLAPALVLAVEGYLFAEYARFGALIHFWIHGLLGAALGFAVLAVWYLRAGAGDRRSGNPGTVWVAGLAGHLYAAAPDVLFVAADLVHQWWMDVFALHVNIHFIPAPPAVLLVVFTLALAGWAAAILGRRRTATTTLLAMLVLVVSAMALRGAPPTTLHQLRKAPQLALQSSLETAGRASPGQARP